MRRATVLRMLRLSNPMVRAVLRSRLHRLLSRGLVLVEYRGATTGRAIAIPVFAAVGDASVVVIAIWPAGKHWWRTFRKPTAATLVIRGVPRTAVGTLLHYSERRQALRRYLERFPRSRRALALGRTPTDAQLDAVDAAIVEFRLTQQV